MTSDLEVCVYRDYLIKENSLGLNLQTRYDLRKELTD